MRRSFSSLNSPVDPRPDASHISELSMLQVAEYTETIPQLSDKDLRGLKFDSNLRVTEVDYVHANKASAFFTVGDKILKINREPARDEQHLKRALTTRSCMIILSRRICAWAPMEGRTQKALHALRLPLQRGYCYQVIVCQKGANEKCIGTSFGFEFQTVTLNKGTKYIVVEVSSLSAAEKYLSVGDAILDVCGIPLTTGNPKPLLKMNSVFQKGGVLEVLIERPVTEQARRDTERLIKSTLDKHKAPQMSEDVTKIGLDAAHMHRYFWRRLVPQSIRIVNPTPTKTAKNRKKNSDTSYEQTEKTQDQEESSRISISPMQSYERITTDVADISVLEPVGYRYLEDDGEDEDIIEDEGDDDESDLAGEEVEVEVKEKKKAVHKSPTVKVIRSPKRDRKSAVKGGKKNSTSLKRSAAKRFLALFKKKK